MSSNDFQREKHIGYFKYCLKVLPNPYSSMDGNRVALVFFCVSGLDVLGALDQIQNKEQIINWIYSLQISSADDHEKKFGGFRGSPYLGRKADNPNEEIPCDYANSANTYTALTILVILGDDLSRIDRKSLITGLKYLQLEDGSFQSVFEGSENDMRFVYTASVVSYILNDWSGINVDKVISYIKQSQCYDHGVAQGPCMESHGGSTYCAIASLALMGKLDEGLISKEQTLKWCLMRQETGFQGRPCKPVDTCYSFWIGGTIEILKGYHLINAPSNRSYLLSCQGNTGGFSKWADTYTDLLHTYMGLCGLSLMGEPGLLPINCPLNITQRAFENLKKTVFWKS